MRKWLVSVMLLGLSSCGPAPKTEIVPAKTTAQDAAPSEVAVLDLANLNDLPPFKGLPQAPVIIACYGDTENQCDDNRLQFYHAWVDAWRGDYQGQRNVAYMLSNPMPGVQPNPIQGCAWRMVIIATGDPQVDQIDTANLTNECNKLSPIDAVAAKQAAKSIREKIKA